jgi:hypothetical protein
VEPLATVTVVTATAGLNSDWHYDIQPAAVYTALLLYIQPAAVYTALLSRNNTPE